MSKFCILLALVFAPAAMSQQAPARASIQGTVVSVSNDRPIDSAVVELTFVEGGKVVSRTVTTRSDGVFAFRDLAPGSGYQIVVTGESIQPSAYGQRNSEDPWTPISLNAGEQKTGLKVTVQGLTRIRGRIQDNRGAALIGANVVAMKAGYEMGRKVLEGVAYTVTDTRGEYWFSALPVGGYYIRVTPRNSGIPEMVMSSPALIDQSAAGRNSLKEEPEGYPVLYYPGTDLASAQIVQIADGTRAEGIDIRPTKVRTSRVRGTVVHAANGTPVPSAKIFMVRRGNAIDSGWTRTADARDGQFDLRGVLPGSYVLTAFALDGQTNLWAQIPVEVKEGEAATLTVRVQPASVIEGRISVEDSNGPIEADLSMLSVHLLPDMGGPIDATLSGLQINIPVPAAQSAPNGSFKLYGVAPWNYRVAIAWGMDGNKPRRPGAYIKSMRLGTKDVLVDGLQGDSVGNGELTIVMATNFGGLDGRVRENREDVSLGRVVIVPENRGRHDLYSATTTSNTGRFQFQGLAPGNYKLFAWRFVDDGAWLDPEFMKIYENKGTPVRIEENSAEFMDIPVIR